MSKKFYAAWAGRVYEVTAENVHKALDLTSQGEDATKAVSPLVKTDPEIGDGFFFGMPTNAKQSII
jgi:hypothetical protein